MGRYTVQHRYAAARDGQRYGPWARGEQVELGDDDAAWINRDSPGALESADVEPPAQAEPAPARTKALTRDRQHRGGRNRAGK